MSQKEQDTKVPPENIQIETPPPNSMAQEKEERIDTIDLRKIFRKIYLS